MRIPLWIPFLTAASMALVVFSIVIYSDPITWAVFAFSATLSVYNLAFALRSANAMDAYKAYDMAIQLMEKEIQRTQNITRHMYDTDR